MELDLSEYCNRQQYLVEVNEDEEKCNRRGKRNFDNKRLPYKLVTIFIISEFKLRSRSQIKEILLALS